MKILVASFTYPPNVDGVAEAARTMVASFRGAGHEVVIATFGQNPTATESSKDDSSVYRFHITGSADVLTGFKGEIKAYQDLIIALNPDVIVFHGWDTWPVEIALPLLPKIRANSILLSHGQSSHLLNINILPHGLGKWLRWLPHVIALPWRIRQFDKVVFLSGKTDLNRFFDAWVGRWTGCKNTTVIPNTIDTTGWEKIPANFRQVENIEPGIFFLCVANYFPGKNQMMALDAFILANIPESALVFIGSILGDYGNEVKESWVDRSKYYPKISVHFMEKLERDKVVSAIHSCNIAVLPSKTEAQPLTILEAMAAGKSFISTNVGCVSEFKGGVIVRDVDEMASAMKRLASEPAARESLGSVAKLDFEAHYSAEVIYRKWIQLLEEVMKVT